MLRSYKSLFRLFFCLLRLRTTSSPPFCWPASVSHLSERRICAGSESRYASYCFGQPLERPEGPTSCARPDLRAMAVQLRAYRPCPIHRSTWFVYQHATLHQALTACFNLQRALTLPVTPQERCCARRLRCVSVVCLGPLLQHPSGRQCCWCCCPPPFCCCRWRRGLMLPLK
jgi:hypothetical protein